MRYRTANKLQKHVQNIRDQIDQSTDQPTFDVGLDQQHLHQQAQQLGFQIRDIIYTPWRTLCLWISQLLAQKGCSFAVALLISVLQREGHPKIPSEDTGTYCQARDRLPLALLEKLTLQTADCANESQDQQWFWHGRRVQVIDGSLVLVPETDANVEQFPRVEEDRVGLSDPMLRFVCVFSLATAVVFDWAYAGYRGKGTGEASLFTQVMEGLEEGDVVLGDRQFCSYSHIAWLQRHRIDCVICLNQSRLSAMQKLKKLRGGGTLYRWNKPQSRPESWTKEQFASLPDGIEVRVVEVSVETKGFRPKSFQVVTTLTDAQRYCGRSICDLYLRRWSCEVYLRDIKKSVGMTMLVSKTPEMIHKELVCYFLAYNLIRKEMVRAGVLAQCEANELSFQNAVNTFSNFGCVWGQLDTEAICWVWALMGRSKVGQRPNRQEPRKIKRKKSKFQRLKEPREQARKRLENRTSDEIQ